MATTAAIAREEERQAVVAFLQALVALPSINDPTFSRSDAASSPEPEQPQPHHDYDERRVVQRIVEEAEWLAGGDPGFTCRVYAKDKQRPNVVIFLRRGGEEVDPTGGKDVECLGTVDNDDDLPLVFTLVAHSDTVPVGDPARWSHPPFAGYVDEAKQILYGRGACDNKGGIAVALYTLKRLQASLPRDFRSKIMLAVVADEEVGANSPLGLQHLLDLGVLKPFPTTSSSSSSSSSCSGGSIYCYPGRTVTIGHRGVLRLRIQIQGSSLHTGSTDWALKRRGANALTTLCEIVSRIESFPWSRACHPSFPNLPLTVTPTMIQGGVGESIVPEAASCVVDCRIPPSLVAEEKEKEEEEGQGEKGSDSSEEVRRRIEAIVREVLDERNAAAAASATAAPAAAAPAGTNGAAPPPTTRPNLQLQPTSLTASITVHVNIPPYHIPPSHPLALVCVRAVEAVTGVTPTVRGAGPANEGYMLGGVKAGREGGREGGGIPCICGFGPIGGNAHGVDEWVEVGESLSETLDVYERVILEAAAAAMVAAAAADGGGDGET